MFKKALMTLSRMGRDPKKVRTSKRPYLLNKLKVTLDDGDKGCVSNK